MIKVPWLVSCKAETPKDIFILLGQFYPVICVPGIVLGFGNAKVNEALSLLPARSMVGSFTHQVSGLVVGVTTCMLSSGMFSLLL